MTVTKDNEVDVWRHSRAGRRLRRLAMVPVHQQHAAAANVDLSRDRVEVLAKREACPQGRLNVRHQERSADALARDVADEEGNPSVMEREVVEKIAADFLRRNRHALELGQPESERALRQHVVLDLPAELELALDPLLLDGRSLVLLDIPVGVYRVSAERTTPDMQKEPLRIGSFSEQGEWATVWFLPSDVTSYESGLTRTSLFLVR